MNRHNVTASLAAPLLVVMALLGSGCSLRAPVEYYQLQGQADAVVAGHSDTAVLLGPVKLADYLQREQIVQRHADGRLSAGSARWAGSLDDEVGQLLLRQLAAQLGSSHLTLYPDRIGVRPHAQVILSISRLDSGVGQPAILEAQWRVLDAQGDVQDSQIISLQASHSDDLTSQIRAQSNLLLQVSQQLAAAIKQLNSRQHQASPRAAAVPAEQPVAAPLSPQREPDVFRF